MGLQVQHALERGARYDEETDTLQHELKESRFEGQSAAGTASVALSGDQKPLEVRIAQSCLAAGQAAVETAVLEAYLGAHEASADAIVERMSELTEQRFETIQDEPGMEVLDELFS